MKRILLELEYDGTDYHGWQVQQNGQSVQSRVQDALEQCTGVRCALTGCSRTDAGVHAMGFVCVFDTECSIPVPKMTAALNTFLPNDIAVLRAQQVSETFHPRYSAIGKRYLYRILNTPTRRPLCDGRTWHISHPLPQQQMHHLAQAFVGTHDFSAFCAAGSSVQDKVRTVQSCAVQRNGDELLFTVEANGFLYHMVRIMVGTLVDAALGRLPEQAIVTALQSGLRTDAGRTAPACGLYLDRVFYHKEDLLWPTNET